MNSIYIRVNDKPLPWRRRFQLAWAFTWLALQQLIGQRAQLNINDVATDGDASAEAVES